MYNGILNFSCPLHGLILWPFSVPGPSTNIQTIDITVCDNELRFTFKIKSQNKYIEPTTIDACLRHCQWLCTLISFFIVIKIGKIEYLGGEVIDGATTHQSASATLPALQARGSATIKISEYKNKELQKFITSCNISNKTCITLFTKAIEIDDKVARFMILFHILLILHKDKQNMIDKYLKSILPNIETVATSSGKEETIYRKLRNDIAHPRPGTNIEFTVEQIENVINSFESIVKRAILETLPC